MREAVAAWYNDKEPGKLAYQVVKYRQRDGWTHRDALRLSHPVPASDAHKAIYHWVTQDKVVGDFEQMPIIPSFEQVQAVTHEQAVIGFIEEQGLTREMIPTQWLSDPDVWAALLKKMPLTAMLRNLGNMSKVGLLTAGNWDAINTVTEALGDETCLRKARVHPLAVLAALNTYSQGHGFRGSGEWDPVPQVVDALDAAFYMAFGNVDPTGKVWLLALDVSGSMTWGSIAGVGGITPRVGSAAMALITANVEPKHIFVGFSTDLVLLKISPRQRLDDVCSYIDGVPMGGTDCALPMIGALRNKTFVDVFCIYTDNETWAGDIHPTQALQEYRRQINPDAKLVVIGMVSNGFSIADPNDAGMLDVVGFDTATPNVIADFGAR